MGTRARPAPQGRRGLGANGADRARLNCRSRPVGCHSSRARLVGLVWEVGRGNGESAWMRTVEISQKPTVATP